jgi:DNA-binding GntR family transcriptional regulator
VGNTIMNEDGAVRLRASQRAEADLVEAADEIQSQRAYRAIRAAIAELALRPGQPLSEAVLAERFGFGRMPVREAVHRLRHDGLVVSLPRKGLFVAPLRLEDVREIYEMLEALDGMVLKLVALTISEEELAELELFINLEEAALLADRHEEWIAANKSFHQRLVLLSNNRRIATTIELLEEQIARATRLAYPLRAKPFPSVEEHRAIVRALRARNAGKAQAIGMRHRERIRTEVLEALSRLDSVLGGY